jgi:redox-sensing transcriptional repressor
MRMGRNWVTQEGRAGKLHLSVPFHSLLFRNPLPHSVNPLFPGFTSRLKECLRFGKNLPKFPNFVNFHKVLPVSRQPIPRKTVYRLSLYYRALQRLKANQIATVSSAALAKAAGVKPTQLRKDLTYFGQFGTRGLGYDVEALSTKLTEALGNARLQPVILVGVGNLGIALLHYGGFAKEGFEIVAAFDSDHTTKRSAELRVPLLGMSQLREFVTERGAKMAILAVPAVAAQEVVNELVHAGVMGILNFSPTLLQVPDGVVVNNVDLALELENLSYFIR